MKKLISLVTLALIASCLASSGKYKPAPKRADILKSLNKCTPWHVRMHGSDFDYKRAFCYSEKARTKKGKIKKDSYGDPIWHITVFDVVKDHDLFVSRGIWQVSR